MPKTPNPPHKDAFGKTLAIGDIVATTDSWYKHLVRGEVVDFTPKKIKIRLVNKEGKQTDLTDKFPYQVAKVE